MAETPQAPIYSVDSSALIHGWRRAYPPKTFPTVWERLDKLVSDGVLKASIEVLNELEKQDDELHAWCKERPAMFIELAHVKNETDIVSCKKVHRSRLQCHPRK